MPKMLRIVSKKEGFRRCGVAHSTEPKDWPLSRFTKKQREAMEAEPNLYVHEVDAKDAPAIDPGWANNVQKEMADAVADAGKAPSAKGPARGGPGKNT